jgi:hypothetical protein
MPANNKSRQSITRLARPNSNEPAVQIHWTRTAVALPPGVFGDNVLQDVERSTWHRVVIDEAHHCVRRNAVE